MRRRRRGTERSLLCFFHNTSSKVKGELLNQSLKIHPGEPWSRKLNVGGHEFGVKIFQENESKRMEENSGVGNCWKREGEKTKRRSLLLVAPKKA